MNINTGEIKSLEEVAKLSPEQQANWRPINRDLTVKERCEKQLRLYAPCGCGSGKKFKFCCKVTKSLP
jgi:uncharacterized protein YchJ